MTQEAENAIKLVQYPVIQHKLEEIGNKVTERIEALNLENLVATEETIQTLKKTRAELGKESKTFEEQRKAIKEAVNQPYTEFETAYKDHILNKYKQADETLKNTINEFELKAKLEKREKLKSYFDELIEMNQLDWLKFERLGIEVNLSTSEKKYKEQILAFVQQVVDDLDLIGTEAYSVEILVEFKKNLNASQAIRSVRDRKRQEKEEADRLLFERTQKRTQQLRNLQFIYHDLTKTYNWISDESVYVSHQKVESVSDAEWNELVQELETKTKPKEESKPQVLQAPIVEQPKPQEPVKEEIFEAQFKVSGTQKQLIALSEYLKSNNYKYENI